jgi:hypothetical protein
MVPEIWDWYWPWFKDQMAYMQDKILPVVIVVVLTWYLNKVMSKDKKD